jgi:hypothetical protein
VLSCSYIRLAPKHHLYIRYHHCHLLAIGQIKFPVFQPASVSGLNSKTSFKLRKTDCEYFICQTEELWKWRAARNKSPLFPVNCPSSLHLPTYLSLILITFQRLEKQKVCSADCCNFFTNLDVSVADKCSILKRVLIYGVISRLNLYNLGSLYIWQK